LYDRQRHPLLTLSNGIDIEVSSYSWLSLPVWALGYPDQSLACSRKAMSLSDTLKHSPTASVAFMHAIGLHIIRGESLQAQTLIENSVRLAQEQDLFVYLAWVAPYQGWMQTEWGQAETGLANIQAGLKGWQTSLGTRDMFSQVLVLLAQTCAKVGQTEQGLNAIAQALVQIEETGERFLEAEAYRIKGELLPKVEGRGLVLSEGEGMKDEANCRLEAEACFLQAIEIARCQQAKSWELRAAMSLARLWQQSGRDEEARSMLADIYNWFSEGFDTPDLQAAKALLEELTPNVVIPSSTC
jgi:adenylate cyclase